jgi:uncharacterized FAD-dependent dehydrogenase
VGTDNSKALINRLYAGLKDRGVCFVFDCEVAPGDLHQKKIIYCAGNWIKYKYLIIAPGRKGFGFLQETMDRSGIGYIDNEIDVGWRIETKRKNYPIIEDIYDPKFYFPEQHVRTFCTNSGAAYVVQERYREYASVNGHSLSDEATPNGMVNFAMLHTIKLEDPVVGGQRYLAILGKSATQLGAGFPITQTLGDLKTYTRSREESFKDIQRTLKKSVPGNICYTIPFKIFLNLWEAYKRLASLMPRLWTDKTTTFYYPELKNYANRPNFIDEYFSICKGVYAVGDGAGTSRGITAAWASGIRAAKGILKNA